MRDFRELRVWQAGHQIALDMYKVTAAFPRAEIYGITSQIRRSAVSISANIAEGSGRHTDPEMRRFLIIAHASATELECLMVLAGDLGYLSDRNRMPLLRQVQDLRRMLNGFIRRLRRTPQ